MAKAKAGLRREFSAGGVVYRKVPPASASPSPKGLRRPSKATAGKQIEWLAGEHSGYHKWVLPKGLIEEGEKGIDTARRETLEEMGVKARPVGKRPIHKTSYFFWQDGTRVFKQVTFYLMEQVGGDVKDHGWEMSKVRWVSYKEARRLLAFEGEREALKKAHEQVS